MKRTNRNNFLNIAPRLLLLAAGLICTYASHAQTSYQDSDGDGWGNPSVSSSAAIPPAGYVLNNLDCNDNNFNNTAWINTGATGFSQYGASYTSLAFDGTNTLYAAYNDNNTKGSVQKYSGGVWSYVGAQQFTSGNMQTGSLAISVLGTPYIGYNDNGYQASVMTYNGSSWVYVGNQNFTPGGATYTSLALNSSGTPYLAFRDAYYMYNNKASVMTYNGSAWVYVGSAGFSSAGANYTSLAIDNSNVPYVAFSDEGNGGKTTVMKYSGGVWSLVGTAGFSAGSASYVSLKIDNAGIPYVAYNDAGNGNKATVMRYNGASWVTVGTAGFSAGAANYLTLVIDAARIPYVAYSDAGNTNKATVMKFNGTGWVAIVNAGFTPGTANYTSLALNSLGVPYVFYQDGSNSNKAAVMNIAPVVNYPTTPSASANPSVSCSAGVFTLSLTGTLNDATDWKWYTGSCGGTLAGTGTSITPTVSSTTTYYVRGENGCALSNGNCAFVTATVKSPTTWYQDADADGWGNPSVSQTTCLQPAGYVANNIDCNDAVFTSTKFYALSGAAASTYQDLWTSVAIDNNNTPYVAFYENYTKSSVMKYNGTSWNYVGSPQFTNGATQYNSLAIDGSNVPYLAYQDAYSGTSVMKYNGSSWVQVGVRNFSLAGAAYQSLTIDPTTNTPYVAYEDANLSNKATVMKFNGTNWVAVGGAGFSSGTATYTSLDADAGGNLYIAFSDATYSNKATVMKYSGSSWTILGSPGFSAGAATYTSITTDAYGTPYLVYSDAGNGNKATVMKYNGSSWVLVGSAGFSAGSATYTAIATDPTTNYPYVTFSDGANSSKATVMKFNGTAWSIYGTAGFSSGTASYTAIAVDAFGLPITAFEDGGSSNQAFVMKGGPLTAPPTTPSLSATPNPVGCGSPTTLSATGTLNGAGNWYWYAASCGGTLVGMGASISVSPTASTTYYARGEGGCLTTPGTCNSVAVAVTAGAPFVAAITGSTTVCMGTTTPLSDATTGGTWTSATTSRATIDASTGVVTGVSAGAVTISYTFTNACGTTVKTTTLTVNASPAAITGTLNVCEGATRLLSDATTGGTWTSSNTTVATVATATRTVTGVNDGVSTISYTLSSGCSAAATFTVNPLPTSITGNTTVCAGNNITLSNGTSGGTWTSSNTTKATIGAATGIVTGVASATVNITYTLPGGCYVTTAITVNAGPNAITGTANACEGGTSTLASNSTGTWSSSDNTIATVNSSTGAVLGINQGVATITYTFTSNGCYTSASFTVKDAPSALSGTTTLCLGTNITLSNTVTGGTWASSATTKATINTTSGLVTPVAAGTANLTYTLSDGCATTTAATVNAAPGAISGTLNVCEGATRTISDATTGGTWTSSNTTIATIATTTRAVSGINDGTTIISYTLATGCAAVATFTVNPQPTTITGNTTVCTGSTTQLSSDVAGGTWTSSATAKATINASSGVVTPVATGTTTITYTAPGGCTTTTLVTVSAAPTLTSATNGGPICAGATLTLTANGAANVTGYSWNGPVAITNATTANATVPAATAAAGGTYTVAVSNGIGAGCSVNYTTAATVKTTPTAAPTNNSPICTGGTVTLTANPAGSATTYVWSGANLSSTTVQNPTATPAATTIYSLTVTDGSGNTGCSPGTVYTTTVTVNVLPTAAPTNNGPVCSGSTVILSANPGGSTNTYRWSGANLSSTTVQNPTANPTSTTIYSLTVSYGTGNPGCSPSTIYTTTVTVNAGNNWLGVTSSDWFTATNWCGGIPTTSTIVTIPSGTVYSPTITTGTASVNNITIAPGATLTITGGTLQISGSITSGGSFAAGGGTILMNGSGAQTIAANTFYNNIVNNLTVSNSAGVTLSGALNIKGIVKSTLGNLNSGGYLTLLSTASQTALIDGSGAGGVLGNVTMQRYLTHGYGYKYISSPFTAATVGGLSSYINLSATFPSFYYYNENLTITGFVSYTSSGGALNPLQGYVGNFGTSSSPVTYSLTGVVNNGSISSTLYNHNQTFTQGFNLAGNPYPSPIDWTASSGWTKTNIDNAIYYFNASDTNQYTGVYSTYINGVSSDGIASNIIPAMQGFFVHVTNGTYPVTGTFATNNNVRVTTPSPAYHRTSGTQDPGMVRLDATFANDGTHADPTVIYFDERADNKFNQALDALKLMNTDLGVPSLYTIAPDATKTAVQALNTTDSLNIIPLGLQTQQDGTVTFNARDIYNLPNGMHAYLYDTKKGVNQDLQTTAQYKVNLNTGTYENRFFLMVTNKDRGSIPLLNGGLLAYTSGKSLFVYVITGTGELVLTDMLGQVVAKQELSGTGYHEMQLQVSTGIYIATFYSNMGKQSKKIFIGN